MMPGVESQRDGRRHALRVETVRVARDQHDRVGGHVQLELSPIERHNCERAARRQEHPCGDAELGPEVHVGGGYHVIRHRVHHIVRAA